MVAAGTEVTPLRVDAVLIASAVVDRALVHVVAPPGVPEKEVREVSLTLPPPSSSPRPHQEKENTPIVPLESRPAPAAEGARRVLADLLAPAVVPSALVHVCGDAKR